MSRSIHTCITNTCFFKVQVEVLQKRQKEKRAMMDAVKRYRKGMNVKMVSDQASH